MRATVQKTVTVKRSVWNYKRADWEKLRAELECTDWSFIQRLSTDEGAKRATEIILDLAMGSIGKRTLAEKKSNHPWLTERGVEAVARRDAAQGHRCRNGSRFRMQRGFEART